MLLLEHILVVLSQRGHVVRGLIRVTVKPTKLPLPLLSCVMRSRPTVLVSQEKGHQHKKDSIMIALILLLVVLAVSHGFMPARPSVPARTALMAKEKAEVGRVEFNWEPLKASLTLNG